ncbi:MAG: alginate lyase family protein [Candidatus Competibacteraceae bacterium]
MTGPSGFVFLNQAHELTGPGDWNNPAWEKLWLYNLHYFDDLNAQDAAARKDWHRGLIQRWIAENPPGQGNGWEPYPLSLRIVNWIKWALAGHPLEAAWVHSLAVQIRFLRRRLEYHLLGNHLLANAKALVCAGLFFQGDEAGEWLHKGLKLLQREIPEQVLADGGHFERSPMYHSIILEDLLDLLNLAEVYKDTFPVDQTCFSESSRPKDENRPPLSGYDAPVTSLRLADWVASASNPTYGNFHANTPVQSWRTTVQSMRRWLKAMCHPDGEIGFFNDTALDIACSPPALEDYAGRLGLGALPEPETGITHLSDSGYVRLQQSFTVVLLDVGPVGPDYSPGHAHADTLSFEWSLFGQRVLVNSGISCYGLGPERLRQRGTAAHNTVVVDGENSSEVWGGFRVARRARPLELALAEADDALKVQCAHDGYRRLPGGPLHWRQWELQDNGLTIFDRIQGPFGDAVAYFHFHPAVKLDNQDNGRSGMLYLPGGRTARWNILQGIGIVQPSTYHPRFGSSATNSCLQVRFTGSEAKVLFQWDSLVLSCRQQYP